MISVDIDDYLSGPKRKLRAMLNKLQPLLFFLDDDTCEATFVTLSKVTQVALKKRDSRSSLNYDGMDASDLISLQNDLGHGVFF